MHELRTKRLRLEPASLKHLDAFQAAVSNFEIARKFGKIPHPYSRGDAVRFIKDIAQKPGKEWFIHDSNGFVGWISLDRLFRYWIAEPAWGQGYATEAAEAVLAAHFSQGEASDVKSGHHDGNDRSAHILSKLGFRYTEVVSLFVEATGETGIGRAMTLTRANWDTRNTYEITTDRLILRSLRDDDWRDLQRLGGVPEVARMMMTVKSPWPDADVKDWLEKSKWRGTPGFRPAITLLDGTLVGAAGFGGSPATCAYFLGKDYWGKGYATEAMRAFLADIFGRFPVDEIEAARFVDNPASGRVLEKLGFRQYGESTGCSAGRLEETPEYLYRLTRTRFEAQT